MIRCMSLFILSTSAGVEVLLRMLLRGVLLYLPYDGFLGDPETLCGLRGVNVMLRDMLLRTCWCMLHLPM